MGKNYSEIHHWLRNNYGKADHCENPDCKGPIGRYEWSLIKGADYEKKRENFRQLCKSCHVKYDRTAESSKKFSDKMRGRPSPMKGRTQSKNSKEKNRIAHLGKKASEETRKKQSNALKGKYAGEKSWAYGVAPANKGISDIIITCPYCGKTGGRSIMKRWHFNNCKNYGDQGI